MSKIKSKISPQKPSVKLSPAGKKALKDYLRQTGQLEEGSEKSKK